MPIKLDFQSNLNVKNTRISWVGIKYAMRDLIGKIISHLALTAIWVNRPRCKL